MHARNEMSQSEQTCPFPRPVSWRTVWPAMLVAAVALAMIPVADRLFPAISDLLRALPVTGFFYTAQEFPSRTCIISIAFVIWVFDPPKRPTLPVLVVALLISGTVNEPIKQIAGRVRPEFSVAANPGNMRHIEEFITTHPGTPVKAARRDQWLLLQPHRPYFNPDFVSFPSGHSNASFAVAAYLCAVYGRGRILWLVLAAGCALARVRFSRHFHEDVLFGGALGWICAQWVFSWQWPMTLGSWLTAKLSKRKPDTG